jgi:hypothetical protein
LKKWYIIAAKPHGIYTYPKGWVTIFCEEAAPYRLTEETSERKPELKEVAFAFHQEVVKHGDGETSTTAL